MTAFAWLLLGLSIVGILIGSVGGFFYCRRWLRDRNTELAAVLVKRSESLKRVDELAGALQRARHAERVLLESDGPTGHRTRGASSEVRRLDTELRHEVKKFLELNKCAERKGAATETLRPPDAEAVVLRAHVA